MRQAFLLRAMEEDLPQGRYRIQYVHNATVNRRDFYRQLSIGLGLEPRDTFAALFASISQHIEDLASQHKLHVVLLLDEAHLLPLQVLDQLHILLNYQRDSKPWLSIILVGLPEVRETLKRNVLQSLTGRTPIRIHIPPLDSDQVKQYIRHRMTASGCRREVFAGDGLLLMSKATGGIMRRIDVLAPLDVWRWRPKESPTSSMPPLSKARSAIVPRPCCEYSSGSSAVSGGTAL
jgi:type II secretory pathway predicted ATPase ExeA